MRQGESMETTEIGEVTLTPYHDLLAITITKQMSHTTLSLRGVRAVLDYLQEWVAEQEQKIRGSDADGSPPPRPLRLHSPRQTGESG